MSSCNANIFFRHDAKLSGGVQNYKEQFNHIEVNKVKSDENNIDDDKWFLMPWEMPQ